MSVVSAAAQQPLTFPSCSTGKLILPDIPGINFDLVEAKVERDVAVTLPAGMYLGHGGADFTGFDFCNVSVTYHHPEYPKEPIHVHIHLPEKESWNSRLMSVGGGGFTAGLGSIMGQSMIAAAHDGYMTLGTDAGHSYIDDDPKYWALEKPGEVNKHLLETFAYLAYDDMAQIGTEIAKAYYGKEPSKKYWNGCSTGGRQGLAAAQRYPKAYDGILAIAPATNWAKLLPSLIYVQLVMNENQVYPSPCELDAIRAAAIEDCDQQDGIADGLLSDPSSCHFDPFTIVGRVFNCSDGSGKISKGAAKVAEAIWYGPRASSGEKLWYGIAHDGLLAGMICQANIICDGSSCRGDAFPPTFQWLRDFLAKDPDFDYTQMTREDYDKFFALSVEEYADVMSTDNPDLTAFNRNGGKMITVHGIADQVIPIYSTRDYYDRVLSHDPKARDYYRYFESPGFHHCFGGPGFTPKNMFNDLVSWVEEGTVPETLMGTTVDPNVESYQRPLCPYPRVARYDGTGDIKDPKNFHCADSHLSTTPISTIVRKTLEYMMGSSTAKAEEHDEL